MSTELATVDGEVIEEHQPITLFGTTDPVAVVERASVVATALADVLRQKHLVSRIGNRDHVQVEGWTLLGSMIGVFAEVEWTHQLDNGWEARAVARTLNGRIVGAAEAMCTRSERTWSQRDDYAIRSMAQTRAVSKALRHPLGFIVELAGYSATPAEELNDEPGQAASPSRGSRRASSEASGPVPAPADAKREELLAVLSEKGLGRQAMEEYADLIGIPKDRKATPDELDRLIAAIRGHGTSEPLAVPQAAEAPPAAAEPEAGEAVPPAPAEPPKPGTDEYKALEAMERAKARTYWADLRRVERKPMNPEPDTLELVS